MNIVEASTMIGPCRRQGRERACGGVRAHCRGPYPLRAAIGMALSVLLAGGLGVGANEEGESKTADSPIEVLRDIPYVKDGHERQRLDLYLPRDGEKDRPLVVWIHGGAWRAGSKKNNPARALLKHGYAVASINYRLSQHAIFPVQIEDCKAAIRWLRAHARKHGIDPERVGVWGSSAGGHLVALLGTTGDVKEFDKGENLDVSSRVQAVCDFFGPTDFLRMNDFPSRIDHDAADSPESQLVGGPIQKHPEKAARANPITYVTSDDAPMLILHGDSDRLVPANQSELLFRALQQAGVDVRLEIVKGAGHGFRDRNVFPQVQAFFDRQLKTKTPAAR